MAPIVRGRKGEYKQGTGGASEEGLSAGQDRRQAARDPDEAPALDKKYKHDIDVVVDRIVVRPDAAARLADSFETALELADGIAIVEFADKPLTKAAMSGANKSKNETHERIVFSARFACPVSGFTIDEIEPRLFSFNNPFRRLSVLRRARHDLASIRSGPGGAGRARFRCLKGGDHSALGQDRGDLVAVLSNRPWRALARHYKAFRCTYPVGTDAQGTNPQACHSLFGSGGDHAEFNYALQRWPAAAIVARSGHSKASFGKHGTALARDRFSDWVREELSRKSPGASRACEACGGFPPQAGGAGGQDRRAGISAKSDEACRWRDAAAVVRGAGSAQSPHRQAKLEIATPDPQGDQRAA